MFDTLNDMEAICAVEGCTNDRTYTTGGRPSARCAMHSTTCIVGGCDTDTKSTIRCRKHYARFKRTGRDELDCYCDMEGWPCPEHRTHGYGEKKAPKRPTKLCTCEDELLHFTCLIHPERAIVPIR